MTAEDIKDSKDGSIQENNGDLEAFLEQKARMESMFQEKFTKVLTVMFTDLKGSTSIAETEGDLATRMMLKHHNDILFPLIEKNNGTLVKTIGDGTLSHFESAQDAVRTATQIQKGIDELNMSKKFKMPVLIRIGLHTGKCLMEKNDIFGDVVNTASRFESSSGPGEVYLSQATYDAMTDKNEIYCRFIKKITLKGKKDPFDAYKAYWNETEIEQDLRASQDESSDGGVLERMPKGVKLAILALIPVIFIFLLIQLNSLSSKRNALEEMRSIKHSVSIEEPEENKK